jgi:ABC-type lipoprotein export system ATPase subunit
VSICILEDVKKTYRQGEVEVHALDGVNLTVEKGDFIAVMGASGSGKTTLLNILGCLDTPSSGRYILSGRDVSLANDNELSQIRNELIGFVFQSFYLLDYISVADNIALPTLYRKKASIHSKEKIESILKLVHLEQKAHFRPNQLSGGQQQRVAIARALINDPELILCDEPTGQLDSVTAEEIMKALKELNRGGKTIVLITHQIESAQFADRVVVIKDGKLVQN